MLSVKTVGMHDLVHPTKPIRYTFTIVSSMAWVVHVSSNRRFVYYMPVEEARSLWTRLRKGGYEKE